MIHNSVRNLFIWLLLSLQPLSSFAFLEQFTGHFYDEDNKTEDRRQYIVQKHFMWNKLGPDAVKQKTSEILCVKKLKVAIFTLSIQKIFKNCLYYSI